MPNPRNHQSVSGATAATIGDQTRTSGHYHITLFVAVSGTLDTANDTLDVALEGSPDRQRWDPIASIGAGDFTQDDDSGEYTAHVGITGRYYEHLRANLTGYADAANGDLEGVDAYVMAAGNAGKGGNGIPDGG